MFRVKKNQVAEEFVFFLSDLRQHTWLYLDIFTPLLTVAVMGLRKKENPKLRMLSTEKTKTPQSKS